MPVTQILTPGQYKRATWKNGLGHTDEIAIFPPASRLVEGNFGWRLSSARIEKASPFSLFPNHDRILVVLSGQGVRLFHTFEEGEPDEVVELPALEPYEFPGDVKSRCELIEGPIVDFSVFFQKGAIEAMARVERLDPNQALDWEPQGRWNFIFVVKGSIEAGSASVTEGSTFSLEQSESDLGSGTLPLTASESGATLLMVSLN